MFGVCHQLHLNHSRHCHEIFWCNAMVASLDLTKNDCITAYVWQFNVADILVWVTVIAASLLYVVLLRGSTFSL